MTKCEELEIINVYFNLEKYILQKSSNNGNKRFLHKETLKMNDRDFNFTLISL